MMTSTNGTLLITDAVVHVYEHNNATTQLWRLEYDVTDLESSTMSNELVVSFVEVFRHLLAEALLLSM